MYSRILDKLDHVARRMRHSTQATVLALTWLCFFCFGLALSQSSAAVTFAPLTTMVVFLVTCLVCTVVFVVISRNWFSDLRWTAKLIEKRFPELDSRLLTSVEQVENVDEVKTGFLQQVVLTQTINHSVRNHWERAVSNSKVIFSHLAAFLGFVLLMVAAVALANQEPALAPTERASEKQVPVVNTPDSEVVELVSIEPGNTELEKSGSLIVLANFRARLPDQAELVLKADSLAEGEPETRRIKMAPSFDDPVMAARLDQVNRPLTYWIEYEDKESDRYYVTLFEYPELMQMDFILDFPEFTGLEKKTINDSYRVSAVIGTTAQIEMRLNKSVESCRLVGKDGTSIEFTENPARDGTYSATHVIQKSAKFDLELIDSSGRRNKLSQDVVINALQNLPPKLNVTYPGRDIEVSPVEETQTGAKVSDDYGVARVGIGYSVGGATPVELELNSKLEAVKVHDVGFLFAFEELQVSPKQIVSYYFWAEDFVSDGKKRRVMSDMFFIEIRDFEQIFRQGEQQSQTQQRQQQQRQQSQQQQQQIAELRQLQKQIINATWRLIRREINDPPSTLFAGDIQVIQDAQQTAIEQVDKLVEQSQGNSQATQIASQIKPMMNDVIRQLENSLQKNSASSLPSVVATEQMIYQLILKLKPNESQVRQNQQQQSSSSSSSQQNRSQQQLQQLQLSNDRNRYEEQKSSQNPQEQQQSQVRQALNRLKELARRQEDINKQIEQLQTALETVDEKQKEEIERRLKRLREQQEELLRDLDELKNETEQNRDNELMQQANRELDAARENVRRTSEALKNNQVSQAAAAGNRAQQKFEDLRDEFRRNNANQFVDQVTDLKKNADELKSKQDEISRKIQEMDESSNKSLRDREDRRKIAEELRDQDRKFDSILEDVKQVVRDAEESEPLLSQQLYDTYRDASRGNAKESIRATENLLSRGFIKESRTTEKKANEGVKSLKEGIQKAAESIIGDEAESLRRAEKTLKNLSRQIRGEIQQNNPSASDSNSNQARQDAGNENQPENNAPNTGSQKGKKQQNGKGKQQAESKKGSTPGKNGKNPETSQKGTSGKGSKNSGAKGAAERSGENPKSGEGTPRENNPQSSSRQSDPSGSRQGSSQQDPSSKGSKQGQGSGESGQPKGSMQGSKQSSKSPSKSGQLSQKGNNRSSGNRNPLDGYEQLYGPSNGGAPRPITGNEYRKFSNDLREIEELLDDPELRSRAAQIREKAKEVRLELKRHSRDPNWDVVQEFIAEPLESLRAEVSRQLIVKENREALVPIDRDPVPPEFENQVKEYFKELSEVRD